jgi:Na+-transporting NADH:ubiquinone oxidoreductase subunit B/electron transport complex protein RnfD
MARKSEVHEGFFVTGMIFPMILPPSTPLWVVAVGVFFGVFFGKELFGGTGRNIFNPALVGRLFVTISFPAIMTSGWDRPFEWLHTMFGVESFGFLQPVMSFFGWVIPADVVTTATPMAVYKTTQVAVSNWHLLWGAAGGSIGETFHLGIILGGIFLMFTRVADWRIPVFYIGSVVFLSAVGYAELGPRIAPPDFQLLGGGMLFGAMYMATDPVTSPFTKGGKIIFGCGCGLLTVLIRAFSGYVEGVMFSIVIMNAFAPLIDHMVLAHKFKEAKA